MEPIAEKQDALRKGEELLSNEQTDPALLRYAALELRRCLEAVVYEKLLAYKDRLPPKFSRIWQAPQAIKALVQLEPGAHRSHVIRVAREQEPGVPGRDFHALGHDLRPDPAWLTKTWNKLGSFLHASWPFARKGEMDAQAARAFLLEVAQQLHPFVDRSFTGTFAVVISIDCSICGSSIPANEDGVRERGYVTCLDPTCEARYDASIDGEEIVFHLVASSATCPDCSTVIVIPDNKLKLGTEFVCTSCSASFKLVSQNWQFDKIDRGEPSTTHKGDTTPSVPGEP